MSSTNEFGKFLYFCRFIFLRKRPTVLKFICALLVLLGLVLSVIPVIFNMDKDSGSDDWKKQSTVGRILWPLCFMFGFVSWQFKAYFSVKLV